MQLHMDYKELKKARVIRQFLRHILWGVWLTRGSCLSQGGVLIPIPERRAYPKEGGAYLEGFLIIRGLFDVRQGLALFQFRTTSVTEMVATFTAPLLRRLWQSSQLDAGNFWKLCFQHCPTRGSVKTASAQNSSPTVLDFRS